MSHRSSLLASLCLGLAALTGCGDAEVQGACRTTREIFITDVYGKVLETSCNNCHVGEGTAKEGGAKFITFRANHPDFVSANISMFREFSRTEVNGKPVLVQKPLGGLGHKGGNVLTSESAEFKILESFVNRVRGGSEPACDGSGNAFNVALLDNQETYRKAAVNLAGRVPTEQELASVSSEAGLDEALTNLTREEKFYDRLREIWNDALLTEGGGGIGDLGDQYPGNARFTNDQHPKYKPEDRTWADRSIREEPTRFIEYVVRNDLPFSDVVAGEYVVVNPYLKISYGITDQDPPADSYWSWDKATGVKQTKSGQTFDVPSSGVLSTPAFLTRWETTQTNRGRKRAWKTMQLFLATDVLKFADRPVDSSALTSIQNPTRNSQTCRSCHAAGLDEIAGAFRGYAESGARPRFDPKDDWHDDLFPPGFAGALMPAAEYGRALPWMTKKLAADPRFGIAITRRMFKGITGLDPVDYPKERDAADFGAQVSAFVAQTDFFHDVGADFMANGMNLRRVVVALVKSPWFRARAASAEIGPMQRDMGNGFLLGPEILSRKYEAVMGFHAGDIRNESRFSRQGYKRHWLNEEWETMFGGHNSKSVTKRADAVSPTMLAAATYIGNIMACRSSFDFTRPAGERTLFPLVEVTTVPVTPRTGVGLPLIAVPENEAKIRQNIAYLMWRLWGVREATDSAAVNQGFSLFKDVWTTLEASNLDKESKDQGHDWDFADYSCRGRWDWTTANSAKNGFPELPSDRRIEQDRNFTVRSWQAVLTWMLSDYRFLHE